MTPKEILAQEFSEEFIEKMQQRVVVGTMRYGPSEQNVKIKSGLTWLKERLEEYEATGNTEVLPDIANFAMIEFKFPSHPTAHFDNSERVRDEKVRDWTVSGMRRWFYRHDGG